MVTIAHLSQADRTRIDSILNASDPSLATLVADHLEPDPVVRAVIKLGETFSLEMRHLEQSLTAQQRQGQWQSVFIVVIALAINAAMVGIGMSVNMANVGSVTTVANFPPPARPPAPLPPAPAPPEPTNPAAAP